MSLHSHPAPSAGLALVLLLAACSSLSAAPAASHNCARPLFARALLQAKPGKAPEAQTQESNATAPVALTPTLLIRLLEWAADEAKNDEQLRAAVSTSSELMQRRLQASSGASPSPSPKAAGASPSPSPKAAGAGNATGSPPLTMDDYCVLKKAATSKAANRDKVLAGFKTAGSPNATSSPGASLLLSPQLLLSLLRWANDKEESRDSDVLRHLVATNVINAAANATAGAAKGGGGGAGQAPLAAALLPTLLPQERLAPGAKAAAASQDRKKQLATTEADMAARTPPASAAFVSLDLPLFTRILEWARKDARSNDELYLLAERVQQAYLREASSSGAGGMGGEQGLGEMMGPGMGEGASGSAVLGMRSHESELVEGVAEAAACK